MLSRDHVLFQEFVDNCCKSSQLCLTATMMAPLTPLGPFNLVTSQTANERYTPVCMGGKIRQLERRVWLRFMSLVTHYVAITTILKEDDYRSVVGSDAISDSGES